MSLLPGDGSRCFDCAFTRGTEANAAPHTTIQAFMCVLAHDPFRCHVKDQVCAGYVELAAQSAPVKPNHMVGMVGHLWNECVRLAVAEDRKAQPAERARGEGQPEGGA